MNFSEQEWKAAQSQMADADPEQLKAQARMMKNMDKNTVRRMNPQFARTAREPNLQINRYDRHASGFNRHRDSANQIKSMIYIFGEFSGGHLVLKTPSGPKIVSARRRWVPFEGRYYHSMAPVTAGVRYSAVLFDLGAS